MTKWSAYASLFILLLAFNMSEYFLASFLSTRILYWLACDFWLIIEGFLRWSLLSCSSFPKSSWISLVSTDNWLYDLQSFYSVFELAPYLFIVSNRSNTLFLNLFVSIVYLTIYISSFLSSWFSLGMAIVYYYQYTQLISFRKLSLFLIL